MIVLQSVKTYKYFKCGFNDTGRRIDRVIKKMMPDIPAGIIYSGIRKGLIRINGKKIQQNYRICKNDTIEVSSIIKSSIKIEKNIEINYKAFNYINKLTVFKNDNIILLNKPAGLLTHGRGSIANSLKSGILLDDSLSFTPAPLHRLDRNTSGLLAASLSLKGAQHFTELMQLHKINKYYIGLCKGNIKKNLKLVSNLTRHKNKTFISTTEEGHRAITIVQPILKQENYSLCLFQIKTGITHQIRSQISEAGHPLAGDKKYNGTSSGFNFYFLHSYSLILPKKDDVCGFEYAFAPIPREFTNKIVDIFKIPYKSILKAINESTFFFNIHKKM